MRHTAQIVDKMSVYRVVLDGEEVNVGAWISAALEDLRAELAEARAARDEAIRLMSEASREAGRAAGLKLALEMAWESNRRREAELARLRAKLSDTMASGMATTGALLRERQRAEAAEALLREAHTAMRACGWDRGPEGMPDEALAEALGRVEARTAKLLGVKP